MSVGAYYEKDNAGDSGPSAARAVDRFRPGSGERHGRDPSRQAPAAAAPAPRAQPAPAAPQARPGQSGARPDWNAYMRNNPDLQKEYTHNRTTPGYTEPRRPTPSGTIASTARAEGPRGAPAVVQPAATEPRPGAGRGTTAGKAATPARATATTGAATATAPATTPGAATGAGRTGARTAASATTTATSSPSGITASDAMSARAAGTPGAGPSASSCRRCSGARTTGSTTSPPSACLSRLRAAPGSVTATTPC